MKKHDSPRHSGKDSYRDADPAGIERINASEFASENGRNKVSLTLYKDDVLADTDTDEIIDQGVTIGYYAFDEVPKDDGAFIFRHNPITNTDYEVVRDNRYYENATGLQNYDDTPECCKNCNPEFPKCIPGCPIFDE